MTDIKNITDSLVLPVVAAPMFLVSDRNFLMECCRNGIVGTLPALNQRTSEGLDQWLSEINEGLDNFEQKEGKPAAPYGVNLIIHRSNPRYQKDLEICVKNKVPIIITSLGAVEKVVDAAHSYGGIIFHDVTNLRHAQKAAKAGVDGLIAVTTGAGGHAGTTNPFALVAEIRSFFKKTLLLAGCISSGSDIAAALQMGADLVYMGTRFINSVESQAVEEYKKMIIDCRSSDIIYTPAISGVPASFLRPSLEQAGYDMEKLLNPEKANAGSSLKPLKEEAKVWKNVWSAGQGVASINNILPVSELVNELKNEFNEAVNKHEKVLAKYCG